MIMNLNVSLYPSKWYTNTDNQQTRLSKYVNALGKIRIAGDYFIRMDVREFELEENTYKYSISCTLYYMDEEITSFVADTKGNAKAQDMSSTYEATRSILADVFGDGIKGYLFDELKKLHEKGIYHFFNLFNHVKESGYSWDPLWIITEAKSMQLLNEAVTAVCINAMKTHMDIPAPGFLQDFFQIAALYEPRSLIHLDGGFIVLTWTIGGEEYSAFRTNPDGTITPVGEDDMLYKRFKLSMELAS